MVKTEQIENAVDTTLNGGINDTVTSVVVTDGSVFPSDGYFVVLCDDELMRVSARSTNTLTVTRGYSGSTAVSHLTGADIWQVIEGQALLNYIAERGSEKLFSQNFADWTQHHRIVDTNGTTLTTSDFTEITADTNAADLSWGGLTMVPDLDLSIETQPMVKTQPSTPYTISARVTMDNSPTFGSGSSLVGICLREAASGEMFLMFARPGDKIQLHRMNSTTSFSTNLGSVDLSRRSDIWMRMTNDGVDLTAFASFDGINWLEIGTDPVGTFLTPDQVGWFGANREDATHHFNLVSWLEE